VFVGDIHTGEEANPWWKSDLRAVSILDRLEIGNVRGNDSTGFYVFTSLHPFLHYDTEKLLSDPNVQYIHVEHMFESKMVVPMSLIKARYIQILRAGRGSLNLLDVHLYGRAGGGEIPGNNLDDDGDGKIDCADQELSPAIRQLLITEAAGAEKGRLHLQAGSEDFLYSLNGGTTFRPVTLQMAMGKLMGSSIGGYQMPLTILFREHSVVFPHREIALFLKYKTPIGIICPGLVSMLISLHLLAKRSHLRLNLLSAAEGRTVVMDT
jgi:hypothetical protein